MFQTNIFKNEPFSQDNPEALITPEEKLFRVIAAANRGEAEVSELIEKYASQHAQSAHQSYAARIKTKVEQFWTAVEVLVLHTGRELKQRPKLAQAMLAVAGLAVIILLIAKAGDEKNFYFYSNQEAYEKFLPPEVTANKAVPQEVSGVAVPVRVDESYRLVGISWDEKGLVAMIETSPTDRARFVRKGDELPGGVKVLEVKESSVTLGSGNHKWQIS